MRQVDAEVAKHNLADAVPNPRHLAGYGLCAALILVVVGIVVIPQRVGTRWLDG